MDSQAGDLGTPTTNQVILFLDQSSETKTQQSTPTSESNDSVCRKPSRTKTIRRRVSFSKPKSRFAETSYPYTPKSPIPESDKEHPPHENHSSSSTDEDAYDEDEEWFQNYEKYCQEDPRAAEVRKRKKMIVKKRVIIEWALFLMIMTCLICSLAIKSLVPVVIWGLEIWKWCLLVMVIFCGRLVSGWVVGFVVFLIERNFMLREKVLYFVYGLRKSFQNCAWLGLVLVAWMIMFPNVHKHHVVLKKIFRGLIAVVIAATIWLLKIVLLKVLASSFHVATFFDRMKESVFHHYVLETLSGPPMDETEREAIEMQKKRGLQWSKSMPPRLRGKGAVGTESKKFGSRRIDMERLKKLSTHRRATAWSVKRLVKYVRSSGLSTISRTVDDFEAAAESEINSEWEARTAAQRIFNNVAKPGAKYIEEEDLLRFLKPDEIHTIFPSFEGALESGRISKSSFRNWVVRAYVERKALAHSLNDTKTAVQQLHKVADAIVMIIIIVVTLLVLEFATTKVILVVTSQLLLVGFMFQNTCKTIFESIIFVFVMHPFDVGDRCVIDGTQMIVEEMNILTTVFLRYDMEKIYYPNSVLITKPISNFRRSPEMGDTIDFTIDASTPADNINALKKALQTYIESKPKYWNPKHVVLIKEIENLDKLKMLLCVQHTMNHQNYGEKSSRKSELIFELKKICENLGIKYHLLPQQVHLTQVNVNS